jgi:hypothetical protein
MPEELEHIPISELVYNNLNQGVKNWIEQDLGWKREDIFSYWVKYEGVYADVIIKRDTQEKQRQRFIRLDNGDWQKKEEE